MGASIHLDEQHRAVFSNRREDDAHHELLHDPSRMGKALRALLPNGSHGVAAAERPSPHGRKAHWSTAEVAGSGDDGDSHQPGECHGMATNHKSRGNDGRCLRMTDGDTRVTTHAACARSSELRPTRY